MVLSYQLGLNHDTSTLEKTGVSKFFQPHLKHDRFAALPIHQAALELFPAVPTVSGQQ